MLTSLDDTPWHQLPTTFDHVATSDPRFFDRLWFAASDRVGRSALQFTIGVYQNMNVVDGGFVVIVDGQQHNLRVSRQLRPTYETACGPLRIEVVEPFVHLRLVIGDNGHGVRGELDWKASLAAQEEHQHFKRQWGRVLEDYSRYDQVGTCSGWLEVDGARRQLDDWWACRDHSWGVRERVGISEPYTGEVAPQGAGLFAFLFYSTDSHAGHVQVVRGADGSRYLSAEAVARATGEHEARGTTADVAVSFVDERRPRRMRNATFDVTATDGSVSRFEVEANGPAVAMPGLGYGGYDDGLGLGVWRGLQHEEGERWDVSHPADVGMPDGTTARPVHRIQPVKLTRHTVAGTSTGHGSLTFICEGDLEALGIAPLD
jgi:hypothetical protein